MKTITRTLYCVLFIVLFACSYENTATVTIDTGIRQQAQLSWFDRVLAFFSIAQPLQADPVPAYVNFEEMMLNVTAPDIDTISLHFSYTEIVNNNGRITLEVPAGSQRTFEIVAGNGGASRIYGGITTVDLSPGQQVYLNIEMGLLVNAYNSDLYIGFNCNYGFVLVYYGDINNLYYVMLYYSVDNGETWVYLTRVNKENFYFEEECEDWEFDFKGSDKVDYKAVGYNKYGQGNEYIYDYNP